VLIAFMNVPPDWTMSSSQCPLCPLWLKTSKRKPDGEVFEDAFDKKKDHACKP
jgi:hypothetical protein